MAAKPLIIHVKPNSDLGAAIKEAVDTGRPLTVDTGVEVYRLEPGAIHRVASGEDDTRTGLTEEQIARSREGIRRPSSTWRDIDTDAFKAHLAERRRCSLSLADH